MPMETAKKRILPLEVPPVKDPLKIALGSDHAGFEIKASIKNWLEQNGYVVQDFGTLSSSSCDYPDYAFLVAQAVSLRLADRGILICGTGIGMAITANKIPHIRAAVCFDEETAKLCRLHNDCNILCIGARTTPEDILMNIVKLWLITPFEGGRHQKRVDKITAIEEKSRNCHVVKESKSAKKDML